MVSVAPTESSLLVQYIFTTMTTIEVLKYNVIEPEEPFLTSKIKGGPYVTSMLVHAFEHPLVFFPKKEYTVFIIKARE